MGSSWANWKNKATFITEPKKVFTIKVPLFNHRAKRGGSLSGVAFGGRRWVTRVRGFFLRKLPYFLEFWDETCREWTLDIYAGSLCVIFGFGHQGAELLSAKGEKMGVLAFFG